MKLICTPILREAQGLNFKQKFSANYLGKYSNQYVLLLKSKFLTRLIALKTVDNTWCLEFVKNINLLENGIGKEKKIVYLGDLILLLDEDGKLWKLEEQTESHCEKAKFSHKNNFPSFTPFTQFKLHRILDLIVKENKLFCLGFASDSRPQVQVLDCGTSVLATDIYLDDLTEVDLCDVRIIQISEEMNMKRTVVYLSRQNETFHLYVNCKRYLVNKSTSRVVSLTHLMNKECLVVAFESGKLVFVFLNNLAEVTTYPLFISGEIKFFEKCDCSQRCVIWSDGMSLFHNNFTLLNGSVKYTQIKAKTNVRNFTSLINTEKGILCSTSNNIFYQIVEAGPEKDKKKPMPYEILCEINKKTSQMKSLDMKVKQIIEYLKHLEIVRSCNAKEFFQLQLDRGTLVLKSSLNVVLSKLFWKIHVARRCGRKEVVEEVSLDSDVGEGTVVRVKTQVLLEGEVFVSLIGNFGSEFKLLYVDLGNVGKDFKSPGTTGRNISQIAKSRNVSFGMRESTL